MYTRVHIRRRSSPCKEGSKRVATSPGSCQRCPGFWQLVKECRAWDSHPPPILPTSKTEVQRGTGTSQGHSAEESAGTLDFLSTSHHSLCHAASLYLRIFSILLFLMLFKVQLFVCYWFKLHSTLMYPSTVLSVLLYKCIPWSMSKRIVISYFKGKKWFSKPLQNISFEFT